MPDSRVTAENAADMPLSLGSLHYSKVFRFGSSKKQTPRPRRLQWRMEGAGVCAGWASGQGAGLTSVNGKRAGRRTEQGASQTTAHRLMRRLSQGFPIEESCVGQEWSAPVTLPCPVIGRERPGEN